MKQTIYCTTLLAALLMTGTAAAGEIPKYQENWDPDVRTWVGPRAPGNLIFGISMFGALIAGDQACLSLAVDHGSTGRPVVMSTLNHADHFPMGDPDQIADDWAAQANVYELIYVFGLNIIVPMLGPAIPTLVGASAGANLQQIKSAASIASAVSLFSTGATNVVRFFVVFMPEWKHHQVNNDRLYYILPGAITAGLGVAEVALGIMVLAVGLSYASGKAVADPREGLFPGNGIRGNGTRPLPPPMPFMGTDGRGGYSFGLTGRF